MIPSKPPHLGQGIIAFFATPTQLYFPYFLDAQGLWVVPVNVK